MGLAAAVAAGVAAVTLGRERPDAGSTDSSNATSTNTTPVERRDLVEEESFDGTLGYDDATTLNSGLSGTITYLRAEGSLVKRGQVLFEVDEQPVILLYGKKPAYRTLQAGVEDGDDVRQLERNLVAMGYDPYDDIAIDREFDWATTEAIERWQEDRGLTEDGVVDLGEIAFVDGAARVGGHETSVGSTTGPATPVMEVSSDDRVVSVEVPVGQRDLFESGMKVDVELPDGSTVPGRVRSIGRVAEPGEDGEDPTIQVEVVLTSGKGLRRYDQTPVTVNVSAQVAKDALAVPVAALLALAEGGYAVEVVDGDKTKLVAVDTGMFANGYVEIEGSGIDEGTKVVVPE